MVKLELGAFIKQLRLSAGLSQSRLAELAQIDHSYLSKLENGHQGASARVLRSLAQALKEPPDQFLLRAGRVPEEMLPELTGTGSMPSASFALPRYPTAFVGRDEEMLRLRGRLRPGGLTTVWGPAGSGKSRLLAEVAARLAAEGRTVAWITVVEGEELDRLYAELEARAPARGTVVVLDDADLALAASADVARRLVADDERYTIMASSRQPLDVYGEELLHLVGLAVPNEYVRVADRGSGLPTDRPPLPAVELFFDRARLADRGFELDRRNAEAVREVCRRLDGLPLALELAALRLRQMTVVDLRGRLEESFTWLTQEASNVPGRHRSLEAAIRSSYDRLDEEQRTVAARLSVISGPFDRKTAKLVAADARLSPDRVDAALSALVDTSLLLRQAGPDGYTTYRWLWTVRRFCQRELEGRPDLAETRQRYLAWCKQVLRALGSPRTPADWARLVELTSDWMPAASSLVSEKREDAREEAMSQLAPAWRVLMFDHLGENQRMLEEIVTRSEGPDLARARLLRSLGILSRMRGDLERGGRYCGEARAIFSEHGETLQLADTDLDLAENASDRGDPVEAERCLERAGRTYAKLDQRRGLVEVKNMLGRLRLEGEDLSGADQEFKGALDLASELNEAPLVAWSHHNLGLIDCLRRRVGSARSHLEKSLQARLEIRNWRGVAKVIETYALVESTMGDHRLALRLLGAARQYRASSQSLGVGPWWNRLRSQIEENALQAQGSAEVRQALEIGASMSLQEAADLARHRFDSPFEGSLDESALMPLRHPIAGDLALTGRRADELSEVTPAEPAGEAAPSPPAGQLGTTAALHRIGAAELLALAEPVDLHAGPDGGSPPAYDLFCFSVAEQEHRGIVIPVFTKAGLLRSALDHQPAWGSMQVVTVRSRELLRSLRPEETLVINPWTELELRLPSGDGG